MKCVLGTGAAVFLAGLLVSACIDSCESARSERARFDAEIDVASLPDGPEYDKYRNRSADIDAQLKETCAAQ